MTKMSVRYREEIKTLILICRAKGFNPRQSVSYINEHLHNLNTDKQISESYIRRTIEETRHESSEWLKNMTVGRHDYIYIFKTIIDRIETEQQELWDMIEVKKKEPRKEWVCIKAYSEIREANKTLWDLYKDLPQLMPASISKTIDNIVFEDTTAVYPEIST